MLLLIRLVRNAVAGYDSRLMFANMDGRVDEPGFGTRPAWIVVLVALGLGQAATTLTLFSPDRSWRPLCDERPIVSGRHPLHFYHGILGAQSWKAGRFGAAYDPAFQAGYPKTPIFDSGSRPAELFLLIGGNRAAAYKIGLAVCCLIVPFVFAGGARLLGQGPGTSCLTAALAQLAWWSGPVQKLLEQGNIDWLLAGQTVFLHAALLVRYHHGAGVRIWCGLLLTAIFGWFCHPILWIGFAVLFVPFYLAVALQHSGFWNLALWAAWCGGAAANLGWLLDWLRFCWISLPIGNAASESLSELADWWASDVWGSGPDRLLAITLLGGGFAGAVVLLRRKQTAAALALGASALVLPLLSAGSNYWKPLESVGVAKLLVLGIAFATAPCATAVTAALQRIHQLVRNPAATIVAALCLFGGFAVPLRHHLRDIATQSARARTLPIGLNDEQQTLIQVLKTNTNSGGRILFEDRMHAGSLWTALLPMYSDRCYLGGLGMDPGVEHVFARLTSHSLAERPLAEWTDSELERFCRRYNVSHVVCWSPDALTRFHNWSGCEPAEPVREKGDGWLFHVKQPASFILKGKARVSQIDSNRIALNDVEPEDGQVVLSLHYQDGWRVSPSYVQIEPEPDPYDPIPLMRLRVTSPVMRLTLTWEGE